jgi:hypothetical protein
MPACDRLVVPLPLKQLFSSLHLGIVGISNLEPCRLFPGPSRNSRNYALQQFLPDPFCRLAQTMPSRAARRVRRTASWILRTYFRWNSQAATKRESVPRLLAPPVPSELGRLCQATLRRTPSCAVAIATDGHNSLAMLVRRRGETLAQLLTRLDLAIAKDRSNHLALPGRREARWWGHGRRLQGRGYRAWALRCAQVPA